MDSAPDAHLAGAGRFGTPNLEFGNLRRMIRVSYQSQAQPTRQRTASTAESAKSTMTIGRSDSCDLMIPEDEVSGQHCELRVLNGALFVIDSGSTNGTFVNGVRVSARALNEGDVIQVGMTALWATYSPSPAAPVAYAKESGPEESPDADHTHVLRSLPPKRPQALSQQASSASPTKTNAFPEGAGEKQVDGWLDRAASRHPFLFLAASLAFLVSLFPGARFSVFEFCVNTLVDLLGRRQALDVVEPLVSVFELGITSILITACLLTIAFVVAGLLVRMLWRIKRVILWGGFSLFLLYNLFENTSAMVVGIGVIVIVELVWRHFRNQALILEELRRQSRK